MVMCGVGPFGKHGENLGLGIKHLPIIRGGIDTSIQPDCGWN
jgi:hypothetical protein